VSICNDYQPGDVVEWRPDPSTPWCAARVTLVEHQGDRDVMFTVVTVEPLDADGSCTLGQRVLAGPTLGSCIRRVGTPDPAWSPAASAPARA
jgi:hypothetical protein